MFGVRVMRSVRNASPMLAAASVILWSRAAAFRSAAKFPGAIRGAIAALPRHVRIELERVPVNLEGQPLLGKGCQCPLQMALADVAPRTNRVGHDVDSRPNRSQPLISAVPSPERPESSRSPATRDELSTSMAVLLFWDITDS